jgi:hypothetical protein
MSVTVNFSGPGVIGLNKASLTNIVAGTANTFYAFNSVNNGGNTNWMINPATGVLFTQQSRQAATIQHLVNLTRITGAAPAWYAGASGSVNGGNDNGWYFTDLPVANSVPTGWEALQYVASARPTGWEALQHVVQSRLTGWEAQQYVARTLAAGWEAQQGISRTSAVGIEAQRGISSTLATGWEAQKGISASIHAGWECVGELQPEITFFPATQFWPRIEFAKYPNDRDVMAIDFTALLPSGETLKSLQSITITNDTTGVDATASLLELWMVDSNRLLLLLQNGASDTFYTIAATCLTSHPYSIQVSGKLHVHNYD